LISIEGLLTKDEVKTFRAKLDAAEWQDGARTAGSVAKGVKNNQQLPYDSSAGIEIGNKILRKLGSHPHFLSYALPARIYPPMFNHYADGGTYGAHIDSALMQIPGTNATLRSDLSATLFLSEPEDYDGGDLEIESLSDVQSVKLGAGDLVLYPSGALHRVTPVTRGARIASFFWVESVIADPGQRALLFDLDQNIQNLTRKLGAQDETLVKFTGLYHNLLRRWAVAR